MISCAPMRNGPKHRLQNAGRIAYFIARQNRSPHTWPGADVHKNTHKRVSGTTPVTRLRPHRLPNLVAATRRAAAAQIDDIADGARRSIDGTLDRQRLCAMRSGALLLLHHCRCYACCETLASGCHIQPWRSSIVCLGVRGDDLSAHGSSHAARVWSVC